MTSYRTLVKISCVLSERGMTVIGWITSSLSVRSSFWLDDEPPVMETGGLPGTITGVLGRMSVGTRPMLWDMGVRYGV